MVVIPEHLVCVDLAVEQIGLRMALFVVRGAEVLPEQERNMSKGVACVWYADGDHRLTWFNELYFTQDEEEWADIDAVQVQDEYVPKFLDRMGRVRKEPGEPLHDRYEVYWAGEQVFEEDAPVYQPVGRTDGN